MKLYVKNKSLNDEKSNSEKLNSFIGHFTAWFAIGMGVIAALSSDNLLKREIPGGGFFIVRFFLATIFAIAVFLVSFIFLGILAGLLLRVYVLVSTGQKLTFKTIWGKEK